jgi:hypothetical protein
MNTMNELNRLLPDWYELQKCHGRHNMRWRKSACIVVQECTKKILQSLQEYHWHWKKTSHYWNEVWKHKKRCLPRESNTINYHYERAERPLLPLRLPPLREQQMSTERQLWIPIQCQFATKESRGAVATASRGTWDPIAMNRPRPMKDWWGKNWHCHLLWLIWCRMLQRYDVPWFRDRPLKPLSTGVLLLLLFFGSIEGGNQSTCWQRLPHAA